MTAGPHAAGGAPREPGGSLAPAGGAGRPQPGAPGGPLRGGRGNTGPRANTGAQRAASRAHPVLESVPGRIAGVTVGQVIAWQVAVAAVLFGAVRRDWTLVAAALFAAVVLALTLVRRRRRWLYQNVAVRIGFRGRRRVRPADDTTDPRLAALRELAPALDVSGITLRSGEHIGVAYDGQSWIGVVVVEPAEEVVPRVQQTPWLPVRVLAEALTVDDIALASVQVLRHTAPAPAAMLPARSPAAGSYGLLNVRRTPASQHVWVALRLDPALCPDAVQVRGGGQEGGQRAVKRCVARLLELLDSAGVYARALDEESLRSVLALCGGTRPVPAPPGTRRTDESWTQWKGDGTVHVTWWIRSWPARGVPMQALADAAAGVPALAVTVSLTLHPVQTEGARFRGFVRLSATTPAAAGAAAAVLERAAAAAGFVLYRLDGEQALGMLATLPLGGGEL